MKHGQVRPQHQSVHPLLFSSSENEMKMLVGMELFSYVSGQMNTDFEMCID